MAPCYFKVRLREIEGTEKNLVSTTVTAQRQ